MQAALVERLVPDELWVLSRRVVPPTVVTRPQGGGRRRTGDREALPAIIFVATSSCTGKLGSKIHLICDRNGLPLSLAISGADMHDRLGLEPLVRGHQRYERKAEHFLAFVGIAAVLIGYRRLIR
ncbi:hypothetical protein [Streptomyces sp. NPDC093105]|uniref:hypothetical protein n=1 Tax=Streptomyces sp. NPDC093105 TaxID=3366029 RepID=UPI003807FCB2